MAKLGAVLGAVAVSVVLAGCEKDVILSGQRFDTRTPVDEIQAAAAGGFVADTAAPQNRTAPFSAGPAQTNAEWSHRAGSATRSMPHLALSAQPQMIWAATIGSGAGKRNRLSAAPIVAAGRAFTIDSRNQLVATSTANGGTLYSVNLAPAGENIDAANGGGMAYGDGRLYVTTGFGELLALDPASGGILWRQKFSAPVSGAPVVQGGTVYVTGRDAGAWAVNGANGTVKWAHTGVRQGTGLLGGTAPALNGSTVVVPYSSGQVVAIDRNKGEITWQGAVAGQRRGAAVAYLQEITGDPVVSGGKVYVGSSSGRTVAFNAANGQMLWDAKEGSMNAVWAAGGSVFLVSDQGRLVRLNAETGETIWSVPMGQYTRTPARKQLEVYGHYGPVLAGGRLVVVSSDGQMRFFSPESGASLGAIAMGDGAVAPPAVAGGTIYVLTSKGQLRAFR